MAGKRVIVTGATGLIGKAVCKELQARGYDVVVFSRAPESARKKVPGAVGYVAWQPEEGGAWAKEVDGAWAIINLAGASVAGKRWNEKYKRQIRDSRVIGTRGLVRAIAAARLMAPRSATTVRATPRHSTKGPRRGMISWPEWCATGKPRRPRRRRSASARR
jgi:NAD dependent epimerase/dehydratase family enzyme